MPKGSPVFKLARLLPRALPFLVVVAMVPAPVPAAAWAPPPTLDKESLNSGSATVTPSCGPIVGTFSFDVPTGTAGGGSYSGSFSESGSVTVSLISVTSFTANFTINATNGDTAVGSKASTPSSTFGLCADGSALNVPSFYSAVITVAASGERWCDQGTSVTTIAGAAFTFMESFTSRVTAPTLMGPTDTCPVPTS
jgi:hypothetical protein